MIRRYIERVTRARAYPAGRGRCEGRADFTQDPTAYSVAAREVRRAVGPAITAARLSRRPAFLRERRLRDALVQTRVRVALLRANVDELVEASA